MPCLRTQHSDPDQACVSQKSREFRGPENFSGLFSGAFLGFEKAFLKAPDFLPRFSGMFSGRSWARGVERSTFAIDKAAVFTILFEITGVKRVKICQGNDKYNLNPSLLLSVILKCCKSVCERVISADHDELILMAPRSSYNAKEN